MADREKKRRRLPLLLAIPALILLFLLFTIDDWRRDFVTHHAEISRKHPDPRLRPLVSDRSTEEMLVAVKSAARRIPTWEYVGEVEDGSTTRIVFVRTSKLWRFKDDITIRVEDRGRRRAVTGESRSRIGKGDLGQNPRSLRTFLEELRAVLENARG